MASGKLGAENLPAGGTGKLLYTVPASTVSTVNVRFANRGTAACKIRLAIGVGANPAVTDYLSYDQTLPANGIIEDTGIVCSAGENVWAISDTANVSVRVHGFEENA
jgi:hypothetical protein